MSKNERTPEIWLNDKESEGTAACGCRLVRDHQGGGPAIFFCPMHDQAENARAVCRQLAFAYRQGERNGGSVEWEDIDSAHDLAVRVNKECRRKR